MNNNLSPWEKFFGRNRTQCTPKQIVNRKHQWLGKWLIHTCITDCFKAKQRLKTETQKELVDYLIEKHKNRDESNMSFTDNNNEYNEFFNQAKAAVQSLMNEDMQANQLTHDDVMNRIDNPQIQRRNQNPQNNNENNRYRGNEEFHQNNNENNRNRRNEENPQNNNNQYNENNNQQHINLNEEEQFQLAIKESIKQQIQETKEKQKQLTLLFTDTQNTLTSKEEECDKLIKEYPTKESAFTKLKSEYSQLKNFLQKLNVSFSNELHKKDNQTIEQITNQLDNSNKMYTTYRQRIIPIIAKLNQTNKELIELAKECNTNKQKQELKQQIQEAKEKQKQLTLLFTDMQNTLTLKEKECDKLTKQYHKEQAFNQLKYIYSELKDQCKTLPKLHQQDNQTIEQLTVEQLTNRLNNLNKTHTNLKNQLDDIIDIRHQANEKLIGLTKYYNQKQKRDTKITSNTSTNSKTSDTVSPQNNNIAINSNQSSENNNPQKQVKPKFLPKTPYPFLKKIDNKKPQNTSNNVPLKKSDTVSSNKNNKIAINSNQSSENNKPQKQVKPIIKNNSPVKSNSSENNKLPQKKLPQNNTIYNPKTESTKTVIANKNEENNNKSPQNTFTPINPYLKNRVKKAQANNNIQNNTIFDSRSSNKQNQKQATNISPIINENKKLKSTNEIITRKNEENKNRPAPINNPKDNQKPTPQKVENKESSSKLSQNNEIFDPRKSNSQNNTIYNPKSESIKKPSQPVTEIGKKALEILNELDQNKIANFKIKKEVLEEFPWDQLNIPLSEDDLTRIIKTSALHHNDQLKNTDPKLAFEAALYSQIMKLKHSTEKDTLLKKWNAANIMDIPRDEFPKFREELKQLEKKNFFRIFVREEKEENKFLFWNIMNLIPFGFTLMESVYRDDHENYKNCNMVLKYSHIADKQCYNEITCHTKTLKEDIQDISVYIIKTVDHNRTDKNWLFEDFNKHEIPSKSLQEHANNHHKRYRNNQAFKIEDYTPNQVLWFLTNNNNQIINKNQVDNCQNKNFKDDKGNITEQWKEIQNTHKNNFPILYNEALSNIIKKFKGDLLKNKNQIIPKTNSLPEKTIIPKTNTVKVDPQKNKFTKTPEKKKEDSNRTNYQQNNEIFNPKKYNKLQENNNQIYSPVNPGNMPENNNIQKPKKTEVVTVNNTKITLNVDEIDNLGIKKKVLENFPWKALNIKLSQEELQEVITTCAEHKPTDKLKALNQYKTDLSKYADPALAFEAALWSEIGLKVKKDNQFNIFIKSSDQYKNLTPAIETLMPNAKCINKATDEENADIFLYYSINGNKMCYNEIMDGTTLYHKLSKENKGKESPVYILKGMDKKRKDTKILFSHVDLNEIPDREANYLEDIVYNGLKNHLNNNQKDKFINEVKNIVNNKNLELRSKKQKMASLIEKYGLNPKEDGLVWLAVDADGNIAEDFQDMTYRNTLKANNQPVTWTAEKQKNDLKTVINKMILENIIRKYKKDLTGIDNGGPQIKKPKTANNNNTENNNNQAPRINNPIVPQVNNNNRAPQINYQIPPNNTGKQLDEEVDELLDFDD